MNRSKTKNKIKPIPVRNKVFENSFSFFPYCLKEQSKLNEKAINIESINKFKVKILNVFSPEGS